MTTTPDAPLDLEFVDTALDEVRANVGHGEAQYNPWALQALSVAEALRAEVERLRAGRHDEWTWRHNAHIAQSRATTDRSLVERWVAAVRVNNPGDDITDEMVSLGAQAIARYDWNAGLGGPTPGEHARNEAREVIDAVAPLIAAQVRAQVAEEIAAYADRRRASAVRYAPELDICTRRANDGIVNAHHVAADMARHGRDLRPEERDWEPCDTASLTQVASDTEGEPRA